MVQIVQHFCSSNIEHITYFDCVRIREILKETEGEKRDFFRRYASQRLADWDSIVREYEQNNIYLGEAAEVLSLNISSELYAYCIDCMYMGYSRYQGHCFERKWSVQKRLLLISIRKKLI